MSSNHSELPEGNMIDDTSASPEIIAMLRKPGVGERLFLGQLGPAHTRITQPYDDGVLQQNVAYHALAVLKECIEARARVAELEEVINNFEESAAKHKAEIEILKLRVREYELKMNDMLTDRDQMRQKAKAHERRWMEKETLPWEKAKGRDRRWMEKETLPREKTRAHGRRWMEKETLSREKVRVHERRRMEKETLPREKVRARERSLQQHQSPRQNATTDNSMNLGSQVTASGSPPYAGVVSEPEKRDVAGEGSNDA